MAKTLPRVFNIEAGAPFLETLAREVIKGFPVGPSLHQLADWTIFLPTQRAVKVFTEILYRLNGQNSLLMPRIRPLGDLEEDEFAADAMAGELPEAMPRMQNLLLVMRLAQDWAAANPGSEIAREIAASPQQRLGLAKSLLEFVKTMELQECDTGNLASLFAVELAAHRENILGLLHLVAERLPAEQKALGKMGADRRRVAAIRREAQRITAQHKGPIIAAGSTGTIPATRALLKAIASHPEGAVILPGLDQHMDEASWMSLLPGHPQAALQGLLAELGLKRRDIATLGPAAAARNFLSSEVFRPSETAPSWHDILPKRKSELVDALKGLTEINTANRHEEARAIGVIFREVLASAGKTATLVTPDRDLAKRVAAEMRRWNVVVGDSAGQPLLQDGLGAALDLLLQAMMDQFAPASLVAFLRHPDMTFGLGKSLYAKTLAQFEVALLRQQVFPHKSWVKRAEAARAAAKGKSHVFSLVKNLTDEDWQNIEKLATKVDDLINLQGPVIGRIEATLDLALDASVREQEANHATLDLLEEMKAASAAHPEATDDMQALMLRDQLASATRPPAGDVHPRLVILGTLEARLMTSDVVILGGLNEGTWPQVVDTGPWLNRTMRATLGLPQPERDLGLAAHDFEQGFAAPHVYLTWSRRLGTSPAQASRWLLRLRNVLLAAGVEPDLGESNRILHLAAQLDEPSAADNSGPLPKPRPTPPLAVRPTRYSVTQVEKLIRDPYAIYASKVLRLEPLPDFAARPDAALRGSLFHDALAAWNKAQAKDEDTLLAEGEKILTALDPNSRELHFWRPHFRRVAAFLAREEAALRIGLLRIHAELDGKREFQIDGTDYVLKARADRIDVLQNGTARLIDYKTGEPPTAKQVKAGLNPQLTLEAAILIMGGFKDLHVKKAEDALYLHIGGGRDGLEVANAIAKGETLEGLAKTHFEGLKVLLAHYRDEKKAFLPRARMEKTEDAKSDFDHLSRHLEWQLVEGRE